MARSAATSAIWKPCSAPRCLKAPATAPRLTAEGRVFGTALTAAFDQIEDAVRIIAKGDDTLLDVACLSTFAMPLADPAPA